MSGGAKYSSKTREIGRVRGSTTKKWLSRDGGACPKPKGVMGGLTRRTSVYQTENEGTSGRLLRGGGEEKKSTTPESDREEKNPMKKRVLFLTRDLTRDRGL